MLWRLALAAACVALLFSVYLIFGIFLNATVNSKRREVQEAFEHLGFEELGARILEQGEEIAAAAEELQDPLTAARAIHVAFAQAGRANLSFYEEALLGHALDLYAEADAGDAPGAGLGIAALEADAADWNIPLPRAGDALRLAAEAAERRAAAAVTAAAAIAEPAAPRQAAEQYVARATIQTSDSQNVHDRGVNATKAAIYRRIRGGGGTSGAALSKVREWIETEVPAGQRTAALAPLERIRILGPAYVSSINATDADAIVAVYARAFHSDNATEGKTGAVLEALASALADCAARPDSAPGSDNLVCADGRVTRVLGALAAVDADPRNWKIVRLEEIRNAILAGAPAMISALAKKIADRNSSPAHTAAALLRAATTAEEIEAAERMMEEAAGGAAKDAEDGDTAEEEVLRELRSGAAAYVKNKVASANKAAPGCVPPAAAATLERDVVSAVF